MRIYDSSKRWFNLVYVINFGCFWNFYDGFSDMRFRLIEVGLLLKFGY